MIPKIIAVITRHPRQLVTVGIDFQWSDKSWTHNVFRVYELIFGRRYGPRVEMSLEVIDGKPVYHAYTWEAACALKETFFRAALKKLLSVKISVPVLTTPSGVSFFASPYLFAIGFDNASDTTNSSSPVTQSFTCTGSNLLLCAGGVHNSGSPTGVTYASVTMPQINSTVLVGAGYSLSAWGLAAPATGANNIVATLAGTDSYVRGVSYTGVKQTGFPDSNNSGSGTSNTLTASTTVIASSCWQTTWAYNQAGEAFVAGTGVGAIRGGAATNQKFGDSNATVGTGSQSQTMSWTTSSAFGWINFSFAPVAGGATTVVSSTLPFLGAG